MADRRPDQQKRGISEALKDAVDRTYAATAGSASETRERAGELLDEVTRRGGGALDEMRGRGSDALDEVKGRGTDAREAMGEVVDSLRSEVESLRRRLAELESKAKPKG